MRGCLAKLQSLDTHWNKFVDAMQGMVHFMSGPKSIENVLAQLADNTSAAIMHAMVNTHKFYAKVCGFFFDCFHFRDQASVRSSYNIAQSDVCLNAAEITNFILDKE
jgi:hypothetical protein